MHISQDKNFINQNQIIESLRYYVLFSHFQILFVNICQLLTDIAIHEPFPYALI